MVPLSLLITTSSRSLPLNDTKCGTSIIIGLQIQYLLFVYKLNHNSISVIFNNNSYPKNFVPAGDSSSTLVAKACASDNGGAIFRFLRYLQVRRKGAAADLGGTTTFTPECLQPRIAPPRASTRNDTRKLLKAKN